MFQRRIPTFALALFAALLLGATVIAQMEMDDSERATKIFEEINAAPYTDWAFQPGIPEGYYVGREPHGMILRVFANEVATEDYASGASKHSDGAILVKENHMPGDLDLSGMEAQAPVEGFSGQLAALTFMVKVDGYNPEAGDWFWAKMQPDGTIDAAGKPAGCIGCHNQVADNDYVFNAKLGEGM